MRTAKVIILEDFSNVSSLNVRKYDSVNLLVSTTLNSVQDVEDVIRQLEVVMMFFPKP